VAGIAVRYARELNWTYAAGLWKEHIRTGLTWYRQDSFTPLIRHQDRAPSWSWASVDGHIIYDIVFLSEYARLPGRFGPRPGQILHPEPDLEILNVTPKGTESGAYCEALPGKIDMIACIHKVTIIKGSMVGSLKFAKYSYIRIHFDEEIEISEPREVLVVRIVKHEVKRHQGAGCLNFFLILVPTGYHENELRRVGLAILDYGEPWMENQEENALRRQYQADLDASLSTQPSRFTIV